MKLSIIKTLILTMVAVLLVFGVVSSSRTMATDDSAATFKAKCALCHGQDGSGNTTVGKSMKIRNLRSAEVQSQTDAQLNSIISKGKGKMPSFEKSLGAEACKGLVAYIRTLAKK